MRANITLALSKLRMNRLLALLRNVIQMFTGNALFASSPYTIAEMEAKHAEYDEAIADAHEGGVAQRKRRDKITNEVMDMLRIQADYVRSVCNGDAAKLATSGFTLAKRPEPIEDVGVCGNVVARNSSKPNTVKISWGKAEGGRMYRLEETDTDPTLPSTVWTTVGITSRQSMEVGDRELYKAYYFRVIALGKTTESKPSDVVIGRAA